jgi:hypothetical protein
MNTMEEEDFSLATLAQVDMSQVKEASFEGLPIGLYDFTISSAEYDKDNMNAKQERRPVFAIKCTVTDAKITERLEEGVEPESFIGKIHTERFYLNPENVVQGLEFLTKFYRSIGLLDQPIDQLLDAMQDYEFKGKITKKPNNRDPHRKDSVLTPIDVRKIKASAE